MPPANTFPFYKNYLMPSDIVQKNCKYELLKFLQDIRDVPIESAYLRTESNEFILNRNYTSREQLKFWLELDVMADMLMGTIWLKDGSTLNMDDSFCIERCYTYERSIDG